MKTKVLFIAIICTLFLSACGSKPSGQPFMDYSEDNYQLGTVGDLTFHLPASYKYNDTSDASVSACSFKAGSVAYYFTYLSTAPQKDVFSKEYKENITSTYKDMYDSFELKDYKKVQVAGLDGIRLDYVRAKDGKTSYVAEVIIFTDSGSYNITMIDGAGSSSNFLGDFQGVLDSGQRS